MDTATEEAALSSNANVLVDRVLNLHPSPEDRLVSDAHAPDNALDPDTATERDSLLGTGRFGDREQNRRTKSRAGDHAGWRKPSVLWIIPATVIFAILQAGSISMEIEVFNQVACRTVPIDRLPPLHPNGTHVPFLPQSNAVGSWPSSSSSYRSIWGIRISAPIDEDWNARCRKSSEVQKVTTKFITYLLMMGGIFTALTSGWWGTMSDRHGRLPIMATICCAEFVKAVGVVLLVTHPDTLGMKWAYLGVVFGGLFGGEMALMNLFAAYVSDVVGPRSKSGAFSLLEAASYIGFCIGPILGAVAFSWTHLLLIPYFGKLAFFFAFFLIVVLVMPESLSASQRHDQHQQAKEHKRARMLEEEAWKAAGGKLLTLQVKRVVMAPLKIFDPLKVILPREVALVVDEEDRPSLAPKRTFKRGRKDWNLTLVAISYALFMLVPGITAVKLVYARGKFDWGPAETGAWITFNAGSKLFMLLIILPFGIKTLRKPAPTPSTPRPTSADDVGAVHVPTKEQEAWDLHAAHLVTLADSQFDLLLAKFSICFACLGYIIMSIPRPTSYTFLIGTACVGISAATTPALQSLSLALSSPREAGKVIASLSALATLSLQLVAPPFFAQVYVLVVDWLPEFIFVLAALWLVASLLPTFGVHLYDDEDAEARED